MEAWLDGYKQTSIAGYLKQSTALISNRISRYYKKQELFLGAKEKGLFWSYDKKLEYSEGLDNLIIENILKYGDFEDLKQLFILYGKRGNECPGTKTSNACFPKHLISLQLSL